MNKLANRKVFDIPNPFYTKEAIGSKELILHDNGKIINKVKAGLARPILLNHECKNETDCNLCINYLRYLEVWRNRN